MLIVLLLTRIKLLVLLSVLLTVSCCVIAVGWTWTSTPLPPKVVVEPNGIDLGVRDPGQYEFQLSVGNSGGSPLNISNIISSCGCTTVSKPASIPVGGTATLRGNVSIAGGSGTAQLALTSNDPSSPHLVQIRWFGRRPPVLVPSTLTGVLKTNETLSREIRVSYAAGSPLEFLGPAVANGSLTCRVVSDGERTTRQLPTISPKATHTGTMIVHVEVKAPPEDGEFRLGVWLRFRQGNLEYDVPLQVRLDIVSSVYTKPQQVFLGAETRTALVGRSSRVRVFSAGVAKDIEIESQPEFLECKLTERGSFEEELEIKVIRVPPKSVREFLITLVDRSGASTGIRGVLIYRGESAIQIGR